MKTKTKKVQTFFLLVWLMIVPGVLQGAVILVGNPATNSTVLIDGTFGNVADWPTVASVFKGPNADAFVGPSTPALVGTQALVAIDSLAMASSKTVPLNIAAGDEINVSFSSYIVAMDRSALIWFSLIGDEPVNEPRLDLIYENIDTVGQWVSYDVTVTSDVDIDNGYLFIRSGRGRSGTEVLIDNVQISNLSVPEPSSIMLVALASLGLIIRRQRQK